MVLDSWTIRRAEHFANRRHDLANDLVTHLQIPGSAPPTGASGSRSHKHLASSRMMTPARSLVNDLAAELGRMPQSRGHSSAGQYHNNSSRNEDVHQRHMLPPRAAFNRPQWCVSQDAIPEYSRTYRDHSLLSKVHENVIPGLSSSSSASASYSEPHRRPKSDIWQRDPSPPLGRQSPPTLLQSDLPTLGSRQSPKKDRLSYSSHGREASYRNQDGEFHQNHSSRLPKLSKLEEEQEKRTEKSFEQLRSLLYKKYAAHMDSGKLSMGKERDLYATFDTFDVDHDGTISFQEFEEVCFKLMPDLDSHQVKSLYLSLDSNRDGYVDFLEFMRANVLLDTAGAPLERELMQRARPPKGSDLYTAKANQLNTVGSMSLRLKRGTLACSEIKESIDRKLDISDPQLHIAMEFVRNKCAHVPVQPEGRLAKMFQFFDKSNSGYVSREEFKKAFKLLRLPVEENHLNFIIQNMDRGGAGYLNYHEFIRFFKNQNSVYNPLGR